MASIPDVIEIFHWQNPSATLWPRGRLNLQQKWVPVILPWGKGGWCVGLKPYPLIVTMFLKSGSLTSRNPHGLNKDCFTCFIFRNNTCQRVILEWTFKIIIFLSNISNWGNSIRKGTKVNSPASTTHTTWRLHIAFSMKRSCGRTLKSAANTIWNTSLIRAGKYFNTQYTSDF